MITLQKAIEAKSDQLNADDLVGGDRLIKIISVKITAGDQPITVNYEGDGGKPWKPCKTSARCLVSVWGLDEKSWAGKSCLLFCDKTVTWAGLPVGGIRVKAIEGISAPVTIYLSASRGKKKAITLSPLDASSGAEPKVPALTDSQVADLEAVFNCCSQESQTKFLGMFGAVDKVPADQYAAVLHKLKVAADRNSSPKSAPKEADKDKQSAPSGALASAGEVAFLLKRIAGAGLAVSQALLKAGLAPSESLEGLTKEDFFAVKNSI